MRTETPDPPVALLTSLADTNDPTRTIYNRPLDDLEITRDILFPSLSATPPSVFVASQPLVLRDPRGVALVPLVNGVIPAPFVDANGDGLADLDAHRKLHHRRTGPRSPPRSSRSTASTARARTGSR